MRCRYKCITKSSHSNVATLVYLLHLHSVWSLLMSIMVVVMVVAATTAVTLYLCACVCYNIHCLWYANVRVLHSCTHNIVTCGVLQAWFVSLNRQKPTEQNAFTTNTIYRNVSEQQNKKRITNSKQANTAFSSSWPKQNRAKQSKKKKMERNWFEFTVGVPLLQSLNRLSLQCHYTSLMAPTNNAF